MKIRRGLLAVGLAGAAGLALFADKTPATGVAEPVTRPAPHGGATRQVVASTGKAIKVGPAILVLLARDQLVLGNPPGADVFASEDWSPPAAEPTPAVSAKAAPQAAPSAPPLPFVFIGKANSGAGWDVFVARAEQIYVVHAGSVIDGDYRVESVAPPLMKITYLPMHQVQQLNIGVPD